MLKNSSYATICTPPIKTTLQFVCSMLKFDDKFKQIPIILFTARAQESDKKMGIEVGADAYVTKPFEPQELLSKIKELLKE